MGKKITERLLCFKTCERKGKGTRNCKYERTNGKKKKKKTQAPPVPSHPTLRRPAPSPNHERAGWKRRRMSVVKNTELKIITLLK